MWKHIYKYSCQTPCVLLFAPRTAYHFPSLSPCVRKWLVRRLSIIDQCLAIKICWYGNGREIISLMGAYDHAACCAQFMCLNETSLKLKQWYKGKYPQFRYSVYYTYAKDLILLARVATLDEAVKVAYKDIENAYSAGSNIHPNRYRRAPQPDVNGRRASTLGEVPTVYSVEGCDGIPFVWLATHDGENGFTFATTQHDVEDWAQYGW